MNEIYKPSDEFVKNSHIDNKSFIKLYEESIKNPNDFWIRFDDFDIYKMEEIIDINFVGGFANAGKVKIKDYYNS